MPSYYQPEHLAKFGHIREGNTELADKFFAWYGAVFRDGALSEREKALIALATAHAVQCPYCIDAYSQACLEKGSDLEQMTEAIHLHLVVGGCGADHEEHRERHTRREQAHPTRDTAIPR